MAFATISAFAPLTNIRNECFPNCLLIAYSGIGDWQVSVYDAAVQIDVSTVPTNVTSGMKTSKKRPVLTHIIKRYDNKRQWRPCQMCKPHHSGLAHRSGLQTRQENARTQIVVVGGLLRLVPAYSSQRNDPCEIWERRLHCSCLRIRRLAVVTDG